MIWDRRDHVLYLRAFIEEQKTFVVLSTGQVKEFGLSDTLKSLLRTDGFFTLEQYLSKEISATIGPFVALGNPEDFLPPDGACEHMLAMKIG